ncbi:MAG: serine--tRNA ligase [Elusimicrobiota bacterium]|jgi:seryl-tRNA synthetase|nr:serine--tRNA ligase [Elusimicrobiota bacterium]
MIDLKTLTANPQETIARLSARNTNLAQMADKALELSRNYKAALAEAETLRAKRNDLAKKIGLLRAKEGAAAAEEAMKEANALKEIMAAKEEQTAALKKEIDGLLAAIPNLPDSSVPAGRDEKDNKIVKENALPLPVFDFEPKDHHEIGEALGILDFERAAKLSGSRFALLRGDGAKLERSIISFMLDMHAKKGYREFMPPAIVNASALFGTGQLPKFKEDMYHIDGEGDQYLISTAEIPLTNLHGGEVLAAKDLPKAFCAYTPCFRKEAGAYGKDTRGLIRNHQFNKVELVWLAKPEESMGILERMTADAEAVLQALGLPFRRILLCAGDMGFSSAKTYDLEVWFPSENKFREISSCSNCTDFQARRMDLRFKREGAKGTELAHTLNGSGVAVGRTFAAILENFQQQDGSVVIPKALQPYFGKDKIIKEV